MKKNCISILLFCLMLFLGFGTPQPAYAAYNTKTAKLNTIIVRSNNGSTMNVLQCYNIDGYNYVRAREISSILDMGVSPIAPNKTGFAISRSLKQTPLEAIEPLKQESVTVKMEQGRILYESATLSVNCFLLNGRYFFRLADLAAASALYLDICYTSIEKDAQNPALQDDYYYSPNLRNPFAISLKWDNATHIITIEKKEIDKDALYRTFRMKYQKPAVQTQIENAPDSTPILHTDQESLDLSEGYQNSQDAATKSSIHDRIENAQSKTEIQQLSKLMLEFEDDISNYASDVVSLVNQEREQRGISPLEINDTLMEAADIRAYELTEKFAHIRPDGDSWRTVLDEVDFDEYYTGENIAMGQKSPSIVMESWMNSEGHRENILRETFNQIGVGVYRDEDARIYWVQLFSK